MRAFMYILLLLGFVLLVIVPVAEALDEGKPSPGIVLRMAAICMFAGFGFGWAWDAVGGSKDGN